jgi:cell division protease FtsH
MERLREFVRNTHGVQRAIESAPCVLLVDQLDGISSRASFSHRYAEYWTKIVNLMLELVTQATATPGIILVGATNFAGRIDPALIRSGLLDHTIVMKRPGSDEIAGILAHCTGPSIAPKDLRTPAPMLQGKTGADIENWCVPQKPSRAGQGTLFGVLS